MLLRAFIVVVGLGACGSEAEVSAPPPAEPAPAEGAAGSPDAALTGGVADLLGEDGVAEAPMGLGMRGEGPQNGGPKYPGLADLGKEPLGHGTYGMDRFDSVILHFGEPSVSAAVRARLEPVLKRNATQLRFCYSRQWRKNAALEAGGELRLRWRITSFGAVEDVAVVASTVADPAVGECIVSLLRGWAWPAVPQPPVTVEWPLRFEPNG